MKTKKTSEGYVLYSDKGKKLGGPYKTKEALNKRIKQIKYFENTRTFMKEGKESMKIRTKFTFTMSEVHTLAEEVKREMFQKNHMMESYMIGKMFDSADKDIVNACISAGTKISDEVFKEFFDVEELKKRWGKVPGTYISQARKHFQGAKSKFDERDVLKMAEQIWEANKKAEDSAKASKAALIGTKSAKAATLLALTGAAIALGAAIIKKWKNKKTVKQASQQIASINKAIVSDVKVMANELKTAGADKEKAEKIKQKYAKKIGSKASKLKTLAKKADVPKEKKKSLDKKLKSV